MISPYNLGLDISITGIGWCVTDTDGRILRKGKKHLYGISMFDEAKTARERKLNRSARRRVERKKRRIEALQELMAPDVLAVDDSFYFRLEETALNAEDRQKEHLYRTLPEYLFTDGTVRARENGKGKRELRIYEIREKLIQQKKKADIRYVYLALAHILKSRGHFLDRLASSAVKTEEDAVRALQSVISAWNAREEAGIPSDSSTCREFIRLLTAEEDREKLRKLIVSLFNADRKSAAFLEETAELLGGGEADLARLVPGAEGKASFQALEDLSVYDGLEEDAAELLQTLSEIYVWRDTVIRSGADEEYVSAEMNRKYARHRQDLKDLKDWYRRYAGPDVYRQMFHDDREEVNYNAYTHSRTNPAAYEGVNWHSCTQERLYGKIRETILDCENPEGQKAGESIIQRMFDDSGVLRPNGFLPLQRIRYNAEISNHRQMRDLLAILENQAEFYPSLQENKAKIAALCGFVIPGFVGPLRQGKQSPFEPWIKYRGKGKDRSPIRPWNFEERVDLEATAEAYINGLSSQCTFLPTEKVLPKRSLLYEEYMVLEELNRIRVQYTDTEEEKGVIKKVQRQFLLPVRYKKQIVEDLFTKYRHVTGKQVLDWLKENSSFKYEENLAVVSANGTEKRRFTASLRSRIELERILGRKIEEDDPFLDDLEKIILWSTVFKDREMYRRKLHREYDGKMTEGAMRQLESFRCTGWGKFSRKLLTEDVCKFREDKKSIIYVMRETNDNFMRIYHKHKYKTRQGLKKLLPKDKTDKITYEMIREMPCSPAMKRGMWHAVRVIDEIRGYMGRDPRGIYVRNLRESNARRRSVKVKVRTRFEQVRNLYDSYEAETGEKIPKELRTFLQRAREGMTDEQYLYLTQLGKCMYSGKPIDFSDPGSYMVSYVVPLCLMADESLDNRVLILREANQRGSKQAMPRDVIRAMEPFWAKLNANGLITGAKRKKLCTPEYDETELHAYLNSQWKETSLTILRLTDLLKKYYTKSHVYGINARLTDQLRRKSKLYFIRELNDFQSAFDAFLTAHIGGFADRYLPKVTSEESYTRVILRLWERTGQGDKNGMILSMYDQDQPQEALPGSAWSGAEERRAYLEKVYSWHDGFTSFLPTEYTGKFYRETLYRAGKGPRIASRDRMDSDQYGGHIQPSAGHLAIISYTRKGKTLKELVNVPVHVAMRGSQEYLLNYLRRMQGFTEAEGFENLKLEKDNIGLNQEIIYQGHPFYMRTAIEAVNAKQLFVPFRFTRTIWQALSIPGDSLEVMAEKKEIDPDNFGDAAVYLAEKLVTEFDIYPKLVKSVRAAQPKIRGLKIGDQAKLIQALLMSMNTRGVRIEPVLKTMAEKLIQGDTRIQSKRIYGEENILVDRSVTGIYTKIRRV